MISYNDVLDGFLQVAGKRIGSKLFLDRNGLCVLKRDSEDSAQGNEYVVELPSGSEIVYFYSPICKVPYECSEAFFEKILELNLCGVEYNQSTFGLDSKTQNIVLSYSNSMERLDEVAFTNILCNFIKTVDRAKKEVSKLVESLVDKFSLTEDDVDAEMSAYDHGSYDQNFEGHSPRHFGGYSSPIRPDKLRA
ncbi:MAG: CesT family type III secretion system chaperone [Puniceicoccales bacterium]|jgi:hypothetical protein|nr:CesT family type III secretion system chaperone [Puniceicoccales bacterium]